MNSLIINKIPRDNWSISVRRHFSRLLLVAIVFHCFSMVCSAYSVLTHEEIVDLLWGEQIKPLLLKKYPNSTTDELLVAHSYAYGGSLIHDMGYYPFGNRYFSDLVHYVRSGNFVFTLLDESTDINEYAFALGALAHYTSDITGHPAVNTAVADEFPKLKEKFGKQVTFAEDPKAHIRTEFGFDVVQVARQRYTSESYHDFIGLEVSKPLLERAFLKTYGIELKDVFFNLDLSIGSFRRSISTIIPQMTRVAVLTKETEMIKENPNFIKKIFLFNLSRTEYERTWGKSYKKPGIGAKILAALFRLIPKVGPLKAIAFKIPTRDTENLYFKSVNETVERYRKDLQQLGAGTLSLPNRDFDTGAATRVGEYKLTDRAYATLLNKIVDNKFSSLTLGLQNDILQFYDDPALKSVANRTSKDKKSREEFSKRLVNLELLKSATPTVENAVSSQTNH